MRRDACRVTEVQLGARRSALLDRLNAAVASGRLTRAQADTIKHHMFFDSAGAWPQSDGAARHAHAGRIGARPSIWA